MHEEMIKFLTIEHGWYANIPIYVICIPIIGALLTLFLGKDEKIRNTLVVGTSVLTFVLTAMMYTPVITGITSAGQEYKGIFRSISYLDGITQNNFFNVTFKVDPAGFLIALITSLIYMVSLLYSTSYMKCEGEQNSMRYAVCSLATLGVNMGVIVAGDFFTLFLFFEGLVLFPYFMFSHRGTKASSRGANIYLYLGVASGLALLGGIFLLYSATGSVDITPMAEVINANMSSGLKCFMSLLFIFGFGGKAGIFLEHFWMPKGYPESPTPTPAMSSGAMIKAGAYGIFRVVNIVFIPANAALTDQWASASTIGYAVIWIGVVTMFLGVLGALISSNSNKMLAYHSVSQMGYIVMGIGCAAYIGKDGAMGLAGALYHIVNHSLFKVTLFLGVGAVYFRTRQADMYKLGGLLKKMPVAGWGLLIAVCGISGIPFFNGFASKTILHHAINEAYEHSANLGRPDVGLRFAEIIFIITAGGTFASNLKLFVLTFLGKADEKYDDVKPAPLPMQISIGILASIILFIGIFPNVLLDTIIGPALSYFGFDAASHSYQLLFDTHTAKSGLAILYPMKQTFAEVIHNLLGGADAILLGGVMFLLGFKFDLFHVNVPSWLTVEYNFEKIYCSFKNYCTEYLSPFAEFVDEMVTYFMVNIWLSVLDKRSLYKKIDDKAIELIGGEPVVDRYLANNYLGMCDTAGEVDSTIVDGTIIDSAKFVRYMSSILKYLQSGFVQNYLLLMSFGLFIIFTIYIIF